MGIGRAFRIWDDNNNGKLSYEEAEKAFTEYRMGLTDEQMRIAFGEFDRNGDGSIDYEEFLRTVRGEMNEGRKKISLQAFNVMDKDGSGVIDIIDVKGRYDVSRHPDFIQGKKTEDEILFEFLDTFEQHSRPNGGLKNRDGTVTKDEWIDYYTNVSMSIDDDRYFAVMMNNAWNLDGKKVTKKGWRN